VTDATGPTRWRTRQVMLGGSLWMLSTLQFGIAQVVAASAWNPPYNWMANYISDLGNSACGQFALPHSPSSYVCSPLHTVMNVSFIVSGILTIAGAVLLRRIWPAGRVAATALVLLVVTGLGKILVGVFPENTDISLHLLGALNIPIESISILLLSLEIIRTRPGLALIGLGAAGLGLVGTALGTAGEVVGPGVYLGLGVGGMERVADYSGSLWMLLIGALVVTSQRGSFSQADTSPSSAYRVALSGSARK
jgi:hypothetical membrane protein